MHCLPEFVIEKLITDFHVINDKNDEGITLRGGQKAASFYLTEKKE